MLTKTLQLIVLSALALGAAARVPAQAASQPAQSADQSAAQASAPQAPAPNAAADLKLHENAVKLVELMGVRKRMADGKEAVLEMGRDALVKQLPDADSRFADEWTRRMRERLNMDDFIDVVVKVYEKHFTAAELEELIAAQQAVNESKTPPLSVGLKGKYQAEMMDIQSEIMGGCTEVGAKLGGSVGKEIGDEHPDWLKPSKSDGKPATKPETK
jgi:hypothetical protein